MPRIKLVEQQEYQFHYAVRLQPRDINYGGHLGNDAIVSLVGSARADMFHSMGLNEGDLGDGKTGIIMTDLAVSYKAEAFMFDEVLIDTYVGDFSRSGFRIFHRVTKGQTVVALAETGMSAFDYTLTRVAHMPEAFLKALAAHGT